MSNVKVTSLIVCLCLAAGTAFAGQVDIGAAASLTGRYPNFSFERVEATEVPGVFVVISEQNVIYYMPKTGHLFFGDIWNPSGKNITEITKTEIKKAMWSKMEIPYDKAVVIGNGPKKIIEVTDPDCPYCRKASAWFDNRDDVTRYVFFMPLDSIHPNAAAKAQYILASDDQEAAYKKIMAGEYDNQALPVLPVVSSTTSLSEHRQVAQLLGVKGTPNFWDVGTGESVSGADFAKLGKMLQ